MSVDASKGVPTSEYLRPKAAVWTDKQGNTHDTAPVKVKMDIYTGDPSLRMPVDPYAPHITPAQVCRLLPPLLFTPGDDLHLP